MFISPKITAAGGIVVAGFLLPLFADFPGSPALLWIFSAVSVALIASAVFLRPSYFTLFVGVFLTLGFGLKFGLYTILHTRLIEPTGAFNYSAASWDAALQTIIAGLTGATLAILAAALWPQRRQRDVPEQTLFDRYGMRFFIASWIVALALFAFNYRFKIYTIGVIPLLPLPNFAYMPIAWIVAWGAGIWLASLAFWLMLRGRLSPFAFFLSASIEGSLAAASMYGRGQMILHVVPVFVAYLFYSWHVRPISARPGWLKISAVTAFFFIASTLAVSFDRAYFYPARNAVIVKAPEASGALPVAPQALPQVAAPPPVAAPEPKKESWINARVLDIPKEFILLFTMRWVGVEGVLATSAAPNRGADLFWRSVTERDHGVNSIYQRIAKTFYVAQEGFAFMTLPGPVAVLSHSGSDAVVFFGMLFMVLIGHGIERWLMFAINNEAGVAVAASGMAYLFVQMMFPISLLAFIILLLAASCCIAGFRLGFFRQRPQHTATESGRLQISG